MDNKYFGMSVKQDWETPDELFDRLDFVFHFNLDVAASSDNAKCENFYSRESSGIEHPWGGRCWCNPPFSKDKTQANSKDVSDFLARGFQQMEENEACQIICFLVNSCTETRWFQEYCFNADLLCFLKGRLKFKGGKNSAPKGSVLVFLSKIPYTKAQLETLRDLGVVVTKKQPTADDYQPEPVNVADLIEKGLISL